MNIKSIFFKPKNKTVVYILGCQRSGTTMLQNIMTQPSAFSSYPEWHKEAMQHLEQGCRLKPLQVIKRIIDKDRKPFSVFKPLNDSQYADSLLELHPQSKVFWVYRNYSDVINSAVRKWEDDQKKMVLWLKDNIHMNPNGEIGGLKAGFSNYIERMSNETKDVISVLVNDSITPEEGAALLWYARNQIFFDLALHEDPRVLLVKYEELVTEPKRELGNIFKFINYPPDDALAGQVFSSSVGKKPTPNLSQGIKDLCKEMLGRLDRAYSKRQISV